MNEEEISGSSSNSPAFGAISNLDNLIRKYDQFRGQDKSFRAINNIIQRILQDDSISSTHQEKWDTILDVILKYVLSAPNIYLKLTVDIFSHFLTDNAFQLSLSNRLRVKTVESLFISLTDEEDYESEHFGEPDNMSKVRNFCKLIARLLINNWSSENQLFAHNALTSLSISAVHTWLDVINKYNGNRMSEIEDNGCHLETCCFCLIQIVNHSGRKLWLNWPDLVDRMYCIIKSTIVVNNGLVSE
uniref:DUF7627 domain-containing protein n=1 Tax=Romanomermis culicivorax TaxID=13658 RepID=A0A915J7R0_ROMCU